MDNLPEPGLLKLRQIVGDKEADPPVPPIIPVSAQTWRHGCKAGRFPKPIVLGTRTHVWRAEDIRALLARLGLE